MIRVQLESDIKGLNSLSPEDWGFDFEAFIRNFINEDFFYPIIKIKDDQIIGTGNLFIKEKTAWLANIIVDKEFRGKGFGGEITKFLVDFALSKKCETLLLIATQLGEPVYRKIGFKNLTTYHCFDSIKDAEYTYKKGIRALKKSDLESVYAVDQVINGENRKHLINKFYTAGLGYFNKDAHLLGFYLPNFGRGLILSTNEDAGIELLKLKHAKRGIRSMIPSENKSAIDLLERQGCKKGERLTKMILGKENNWNPASIYSYGGGYCG